LKLRFKNDLYRLRRALGSDVILFENELYSFNRSMDYEYDVENFEVLLERAEADPDPGQKIELLRAAVHLRDGPYLQDVDATWALAERERLEGLYLNLLRDLAGILHRQGRLAEALQVCQRALQADPCQEEFHRLAMELHAGRGDRPAVIRQYQSCREALRAELDVEPSPATEALYKRLVR
jgi:two-component SAPR family response regulator